MPSQSPGEGGPLFEVKWIGASAVPRAISVPKMSSTLLLAKRTSTPASIVRVGFGLAAQKVVPPTMRPLVTTMGLSARCQVVLLQMAPPTLSATAGSGRQRSAALASPRLATHRADGARANPIRQV